MRTDLAASYGEERLPRYTSYPTAPHFSPAVGPDTYAEWLAGLPAGASASLYLHVPFCREMCWYCGCHTQIVRRDGLIAAYQRTLRSEIAQVSETIGRRIKVEHIHFGGGTPTIMAPEAFAELMAAMRHSFFVLPSAEIAVEIDPRTLTAEMVEAMRLSGVNRASLGVQSFDPVVQRAINRVQSYEQTASVVDRLHRAGINGINFDLIYGLPHQTVASCLDTVRRSLELGPDRFSVFGYAHVPDFKKHQRMINEAVLPDGLAASRPGLRDRQCVEGGRLRADRARSFRAARATRMAVAFENGRCGAISRATPPTRAKSCSVSARARSGICRRAMCRTRCRSAPMRRASPPAASPPRRATGSPTTTGSAPTSSNASCASSAPISATSVRAMVRSPKRC